jgi:hypothetical protein
MTFKPCLPVRNISLYTFDLKIAQWFQHMTVSTSQESQESQESEPGQWRLQIQHLVITVKCFLSSMSGLPLGISSSHSLVVTAALVF